LRRFECALAPTKQAVLAQFEELGEENETILKHTGKLDFYNIARFDLNELCKDPTTILHDLKKYIDGFSANVKEIFKKFQFIKLIEELHEKNKLFTLCNLYKDIDLSLKTISNADMGYVFEETLRRFNDQNPDGEHYTAPEVIRLLSRVLIAGDNRNLTPSHLIKIMDAACGTGGMLFGLKKELVETLHINPDNITVFGQENNGETYAIACSDMLIKGEDPSDIKYGSTLQADQSSGELMDFVIMNPPFGVE
jgi:type I restriction enzyme M protein